MPLYLSSRHSTSVEERRDLIISIFGLVVIFAPSSQCASISKGVEIPFNNAGQVKSRFSLLAIRWSLLLCAQSIQVTAIASAKIAIIGIKTIMTFLEKKWIISPVMTKATNSVATFFNRKSVLPPGGEISLLLKRRTNSQFEKNRKVFATLPIRSPFLSWGTSFIYHFSSKCYKTIRLSGSRIYRRSGGAVHLDTAIFIFFMSTLRIYLMIFDQVGWKP